MYLKSFCRIDLLIPIACSLLTGCMLGPDFHPPASPRVSSYTAKPMPAKTAHVHAPGSSGNSQEFISTQEIPTQWWELFHSKEINELVERGIAHSPNLAAAYASLRQAQETLNAQIGNSLFPAFSATVGGQRQKFNFATIGGSGQQSTIFSLYNANANVSYTFDIFGGARRQIESLQAQVDYQQFELIGAYLSLTSNIVTTAVAAAAYQEQIDATLAIIKSDENQLKITRKQYELGGVAEASILAQQATLEQVRATLYPLQQSLEQSLHALDVLVGDLPNKPLQVVRLDKLVLPTKLPVTMPSSLVRQRPDVRAAEALLHAANANIGVATAALFPQFTLTGAYGWQGAPPSALLAPPTNVWNIASQLTQPIFQGGALLAQRRGAIDAYQLAAAQYKQTVLTAFQNVADVLRALDNDAKRLKATTLATRAALRNFNILNEQYQLGGVSYTNVLVAQSQYQQSILARIQSQAARYNDTVALFQALGGGWWNQSWCVKECLYEAT